MKGKLIWPVHFHTTEKQRLDLEEIARDEEVSLGEAARTLLDEAMEARRAGR